MSLNFVLGALAGLAKCSAKAAQDIRSAHRKTVGRLKLKRSRSVQPGLEPVPEQEPATKKGPVSQRPIFEDISLYGQQVPKLDNGAGLRTASASDGGGAPELDISLPFVCRDSGTAAAKMLAHPTIKAARTAFAAIWKTSPLRANPGRAALKLSAPASEIAAEALAAILVGRALSVDTHEALRALLAPVCFAVAAGSAAAFSEQSGMPSLRVASAGIRQVIMMPAAVARTHGSVGVAGADASSSTALKLSQTVLNLTQEEIADAARRFPVYWSYVGPGDVLYTPANWITCERALMSKPIRDARSSGFCQSRCAAATDDSRRAILCV